MPRGRKTALTICLTPAERETLLRWQRATTITAGRARRARILLLLDEQVSISQIVRTLGISRRNTYKWVERFQAQGIEGLADKPGRGSWPRRRAAALPGQPDNATYGDEAYAE